MARATLLGYVRKTKQGDALKVSISVEAFEQAERYTAQDGHEFVSMIINIDKLQMLIAGQKEVTGVSQIVEGDINGRT